MGRNDRLCSWRDGAYHLVQFEVADLFKPNLAPFGSFDKLLLDPPREGAVELVKSLPEGSRMIAVGVYRRF